MQRRVLKQAFFSLFLDGSFSSQLNRFFLHLLSPAHGIFPGGFFSLEPLSLLVLLSAPQDPRHDLARIDGLKRVIADFAIYVHRFGGGVRVVC